MTTCTVSQSLFQSGQHACLETSSWTISTPGANISHNYTCSSNTLGHFVFLTQQTSAPAQQILLATPQAISNEGSFGGYSTRHYSLGRFRFSETFDSTEPWRLVAETTAAAQPISADAIGGPHPGSICAHASLFSSQRFLHQLAHDTSFSAATLFVLPCPLLTVDIVFLWKKADATFDTSFL